MNRWLPWSVVLPLFAAGCTCGAFDPNVTRFACESDEDCGPGFVCGTANGGRECVLVGDGGATGGGSGGGSGGGTGGGALGGGGGYTGGGTGGGATGGGTGGGVTGGGTGGGVTGGGTGGGVVTGGGTGGGATGGGAGGGTGGGATGGGAGGGGGTISAPDRLAFTSAPQTVSTSTCSAPLTVETRNAFSQPTPVLTPTVITFSTTGPSGGLTFFRDSTCTMPGNTATIATGASQATAFFRATSAGSPVITAASPPLINALQTQTVQAPPNALAFVSPPPPVPTPAGTCFTATLEARALATPTVLLADAPISLQSGIAGGLRFFTGALCAGSAINSVTIPSGQSRVSFSVKTISGRTNSIVATATFATTSQQFDVEGVVRRGVCPMTNVQMQVNCTITPQHGSTARTVVFYQGTSSADSPNPGQIRCRLTQPDILSCERILTSNLSAANISWQTAELVSGLNVQRGSSPTCPLGPTTLPLAGPINASSSFVLSSFTGYDNEFDSDDMYSARLTPDGGAVLLDTRTTQQCRGYEYQVVELTGASVLRGGAGSMLMGQRQLVFPMTVAASPNTVVFNQTTISPSVPYSTSMCNMFARAEVSTPTTLRFTRGDDATTVNCADVAIADLQWERVDFGARARVQTFVVPLQNNSVDVPIGLVDSTRTVVFAGGQLAGGQATGETSYDNTGNDSIGAATARFDLISDDIVRITRGRSTSSATVTMYVVELEP